MTYTTGLEGERATQYQSAAIFTKGVYYSAGSVDKHRQFVKQRYPATHFVCDLHLSGCKGNLAMINHKSRSVCYTQRMRSPCSLPSSVGLETKQSQPLRSSRGSCGGSVNLAKEKKK
jgi:hypothetical protein